MAHYYPKIHKLLEFQNAKSLSKKTHAPVRADNLGGKDYCFWAIKLYTEDLIRQFGEGTPVPYPLIEDWAILQFDDHKKGKSTVRAKCRSIWNWNDARDWELPKYKRARKTKNDKELKMTRQERALKNTELRAERAKNKVINVTTGILSETYKKKNGNWHIGMIAKDTNLTVKTVSKYLKELKSSGTIA